MEHFVPLPTSFLQIAGLVGAGWFTVRSEVALLTPAVRKAAAKCVQRVTLPIFVFQALAAGTTQIRHSATVACIAISLHFISCFAVSRFLTRNRQNRDQATFTTLSVGNDSSGWGISWCSTVWGLAGAQAATMVACVSALLLPFFSWAAYRLAGMSVPASLKHMDGGSYRGKWKKSRKEGLGVYTYPNGARYEGWWRNNVKHGRGVYHYADGGRFEGEFVNGARNGVGVRVWPHGAVRAAYFEANKRVKAVELEDAAQVMQDANEAADAARHVPAGSPTLAQAAKKAFLSGPVLGACSFVAAALFQLPITEATHSLLSLVASIHIPLCLILLGASLPTSMPEKYHAPPIRTVLMIRLTSALLIGAGALLGATQSLMHTMTSAAIVTCLLLPVSVEVSEDAKESGLNASFIDGVVVTSCVVSTLSMGMFCLQAWIKNFMPIFVSTAASSTASVFPLVDHCVFQLCMLVLVARFVPPLFATKVVKMTLKVPQSLTGNQAAKASPQGGQQGSSGQDLNPGLSSALSPITVHRSSAASAGLPIVFRGYPRTSKPRVIHCQKWLRQTRALQLKL